MNIEEIIQKRMNEVKLAVEAEKLVAEQEKLRRDRKLAPWLIGASVLSGVTSAIVVAIIAHLWK